MTSVPIMISENIKKVEINEILNNTQTIFVKRNQVQLKKIELKLFGETNKKIKEIGKVSINLLDYLDAPGIEKIYKIEKTKDQNAKICLSIKATSLGHETPATIVVESTSSIDHHESEGEGEKDNIFSDLKEEHEIMQQNLEKIRNENENLKTIIEQESKYVEENESHALILASKKEKEIKLKMEVDELSEHITNLRTQLDSISNENKKMKENNTESQIE